MSDIKAIIQEYQRCKSHSIPFAMALIVRVEGSSYRRPGARMLITSQGNLTGAISGGCLEGDIIRKAQLVIHTQAPRIARYDTFLEEELPDEETPIQNQKNPGCEGIITVLIVPVEYNDPRNPIALLQNYIQRRCGMLLATAYSSDSSGIPAIYCHDILYPHLDADTPLTSQTGFRSVPYLSDVRIREQIRQATIGKKQHTIWNFNPPHPEVQILCEYITPPVHLIIFGSGPDALPLAEIAGVMGWDVSIADRKVKPTVATSFPSGCRIFNREEVGLSAKVVTDAYTCLVLLTHNYEYDKALLPPLLDTDAFYIGMIGPNKKRERIIRDLIQEGALPSEEVCNRLYCPAGIHLGAETPQEIALSIIAEILSVQNMTTAGSLRDMNRPIHKDLPLMDETHLAQ